MKKLNTYSVLLKRPDYITDGDDAYFYTVAEAIDVAGAVDSARAEAFAADGGTDDDMDSITDYALVLVIAGDHPDIHFQDEREG